MAKNRIPTKHALEAEELIERMLRKMTKRDRNIRRNARHGDKEKNLTELVMLQHANRY